MVCWYHPPPHPFPPLSFGRQSLMSVWTILAIVSNIDLIRNLKASGGFSGIQTHDLPAVFESLFFLRNLSVEDCLGFVEADLNLGGQVLKKDCF